MPGKKQITYRGRTRSLTEWSKKLGIPASTLSRRLKTLPPEKAFLKPDSSVNNTPAWLLAREAQVKKSHLAAFLWPELTGEGTTGKRITPGKATSRISLKMKGAIRGGKQWYWKWSDEELARLEEYRKTFFK